MCVHQYMPSTPIVCLCMRAPWVKACRRREMGESPTSNSVEEELGEAVVCQIHHLHATSLSSACVCVCMHTVLSCMCVIEGLGRVQVMQCRLRVCACDMCMCAQRHLAAMEAWNGY